MSVHTRIKYRQMKLLTISDRANSKNLVSNKGKFSVACKHRVFKLDRI